DLTLAAALEAPDHPQLDRDIGEVCGLGTLGVPVRDALPPEQRLDVLVDFSSPEGTRHALKTALGRKIPLVVATTGHTHAQRDEIEADSHQIPILMAPNMSLAVNVLFALVKQAATLLAGKDFDVEIVQRHHRFKKDAPSGTALHFARIVQHAMHQK